VGSPAESGFYRDFGLRLRQARGAAGLSQEALAARAGLSRTSVSNIEGGRQRVLAHMVYSLAAAVGVDPKELLPDRAVGGDGDRSVERASKREEDSWVLRVIGAGTGEREHEA
jgi:transcriptional regulator with XRE-family HTH domain